MITEGFDTSGHNWRTFFEKMADYCFFLLPETDISKNIFPTFTPSIHFRRNLEFPLDKTIWFDKNTDIK